MTLASKLCDLSFKIAAHAKKNIRPTLFVSQIGLVDGVFILVTTLASLSLHQNFNYLCTPTDDSFIPRVTVNPDFSFGAVRKAVAEIKDRLEEFGREELHKISKSGLTSETDRGASTGCAGNNSKPSFSKYKCVLSYSERGPRVHDGESDIGQKEQR